ncbi:glycoside hydrolase family 2 TIM barrel-domain containing protein [Oxalobacteraceae bacterium A2-2]
MTVLRQFAALGALLATFTGAQAAYVYPSADAAYSLSLNGSWSFKYIPSLAPGADAGFTAPPFDVSGWKTIPVPANWELQGFAEPSYADELKDGLGLYRRTFKVPAGWQGRQTFLRFEGVGFGYEVWVNGKKAGESSASAFNRHTFDVTPLLQEGDNVLAVRVTTKPHGYEFDLNDDWSLSGIYRDVTLISVPATHMQDLGTKTTLAADGSAELALDVLLSRDDGDVRARLLDPAGRVVAEQVLARSGDSRRAVTFRVARPRLWTAETPSLYSLQLTVSAGGKPIQSVNQRIGLREVRIDGSVLLLNGQPIKMRGVNHHDLDPRLGRAVDEAGIRRDLELLKKANVNYLRTSHYPPHPRLLDLCDEMGIYVMDEVAIGHGEQNLEKPEYLDNILARVEPTIARDKNHASVLVWSIGNENPITDAELKTGQLAKQLDPTRPITYPKIGSYFAKNYERIPAFVDIYAPHYPSNATLKNYASTLKRPTILTEYAHALGLATDRMQEQWEILQNNPVFAGGSIWHFHDQGLLRTSGQAVDPNKPTQLVWTDPYHYYDTHGLDGTDGLVYSDRTPQVDYWQMRKVYAPVQFADRGASVRAGAQEIAVSLENRYDFRSLDGVKLYWSLQRNGNSVQQGQAALHAKAHGRETVKLKVKVPSATAPVPDVLTLNLRAVDEQGLEINERTMVLEQQGAQRPGWTASLKEQGAPLLVQKPGEITITTAQWVLAVQRASGKVTIRDRAGKLLVDGIYPHTGRKPTMAEALGAKKSGLWLSSIATALESPVVEAQEHDGGVQLSISGAYQLPAVQDTAQANAAPAAPDDLIPDAGKADKAAPGRERSVSGKIQLFIGRNGAIQVGYDFTPSPGEGHLSEAGLSLVAPAGMGEFRWIGQGPYAGYPGKDKLNEFGLYHLNRADLRFQGNRRGTELALLTDGRGAGFALSVAASDVAVERAGDTTLLSHNAQIGGLGNKGTGPETSLAVEKVGHIAGAFTLVPLTGTWPGALVRWFGQPAPAKDVFKPFYHSYDQ